MANAVVSLHIGGGIGARALADRILVDHLHMLKMLPVAFQRDVLARQLGHFVEVALHGWIEDAFHKRRLTTSADSRHHRQRVHREAHVDASQVVHAAASQLDCHIPRTSRRGHIDGFATREVVKRVRTMVLVNAILVDIFRIAFENNFSTVSARIRADIDEIVGCPHDFLVVLHHDDRIAQRLQLF